MKNSKPKYKELEYEKKPKKPKLNDKFDPLRKNKKYYEKTSYENV